MCVVCVYSVVCVVYVWCAYVLAACVPGLWRPEDDIRFPDALELELQVVVSQTVSPGNWTLGPLQEQQLHVSAQNSQAPFLCF